MEDLNVAFRLKGFIDSESLSHSQFADRCGIPRPSLSQLLSGRNKKISDVLVGQIHKAFPDLSILWLLFGEGPMLVAGSAVGSDNTQQLNSGIPTLDLFSDAEKNPDGQSGSVLNTNVRALNRVSDDPKSTDYVRIEADLKIAELQMQIDKMKQNPRKVTHITVYYDDSTFETFYPQS